MTEIDHIHENTANEDLLAMWFYGNKKAFDVFFHRHMKRVRAYCFKKGVAENDLDDILQEIFLRLHKKIHLYEQGRQAMPWFFTIVHNTCIDWFRKIGKKQHLMDYIEEGEGKINFLSLKNNLQEQKNEEKITQVQFALDTLQENEKKLFALRNEAELSFKEISQQVGKSEVSVRKAYQRALDTIKKILIKKEE